MIATEYNHTLCLGSPADVITPSMLLQQMRLYEDDKTERHNFQMMHFILICFLLKMIHQLFWPQYPMYAPKMYNMQDVRAFKHTCILTISICL